jgi:hypothetical protein
MGSWTWMHLATAIAVYWILLIAGSWLYAMRPGRAARQAAARASATTQTLVDVGSGEHFVSYGGKIRLGPILAVAVGPPLLAVAIRLLI